MPPNMQFLDDVEWMFEEGDVIPPPPPRLNEAAVNRVRMFATRYGGGSLSGRSSIAAKERNSKMRISFTLEIAEDYLTTKALKAMKPQAVIALHSLLTSARGAGAKGKLLAASAEPLLDGIYFSIEARGLKDACANLNPVFEAAREAAVKEAANGNG